MKEFKAPTMNVQKLEQEEIVSSSSCFETFACVDCYCTAVTCDDAYVCDGLKCPILDTI